MSRIRKMGFSCSVHLRLPLQSHNSSLYSVSVCFKSGHILMVFHYQYCILTCIWTPLSILWLPLPLMNIATCHTSATVVLSMPTYIFTNSDCTRNSRMFFTLRAGCTSVISGWWCTGWAACQNMLSLGLHMRCIQKAFTCYSRHDLGYIVEWVQLFWLASWQVCCTLTSVSKRVVSISVSTRVQWWEQ